ncbi:uncharacterized protein [Macrobrachium rosenbergii]|uniref:uncharacterized protein n=1 Tax=Macrobrachium rosenbergii TaxID=79674 RepID=UPI0034D49A40
MMKITWVFTVLALSTRSIKAPHMHFEKCGTALCPTSNIVEEVNTASERICAAVCLMRYNCLGFCYNGPEQGCGLFNLHMTLAKANAVAGPRHMYCGRDLDEYSRFGRKAYRFFPTPVIQAASFTSCFNDGAYLALPLDAVENSRLASLAGGADIWINGTDAPSEGNWVAMGTGTPLPYFSWNTGEPNGGTVQNCMFMHGWNLGWVDVGCNIPNTYGYICEKVIYWD